MSVCLSACLPESVLSVCRLFARFGDAYAREEAGGREDGGSRSFQ